MPKKKVLFIEDDVDSANVLTRALNFKGYESVWAADGQSGLEQYAEVQPDILLVDINLPDIDGLDIVQRLRAEGQRLPIVAITARAFNRQPAFDAGCDAFMTKPISVHELFRLMEQLLASSAS